MSEPKFGLFQAGDGDLNRMAEEAAEQGGGILSLRRCECGKAGCDMFFLGFRNFLINDSGEAFIPIPRESLGQMGLAFIAESERQR